MKKYLLLLSLSLLLGNQTFGYTFPPPVVCNISTTGFANIHCSSNGTGSTGADDVILFDLAPTGTGLGSGYNVSVSNAFPLIILATSQPPTNVDYNTVTTFQIGAGSANGQPFNIIITDNADAGCSVTITVNPGISPCSSGLDDGVNLTNLLCNDNGTPGVFSDDFLTFTIQPFPAGSNQGYTAGCDLATTTLANGDPATNIAFGPPVNLRTASGIHFFPGGSVGFDDLAGGYSGGESFANPCFNPPCAITNAGLTNIACNNNGTLENAADDYITFRLRPVGNFLGTGYFLGGNGNPSPVSNVVEPYPYGPIFDFRLANGTAAAGTYNLTITDDPSSNCAFPLTINATGTCSTPPAPCDILSINFSGNPGACNDNGTPNDPSDDFFTHNLQASFINRPSTGSLQIVPGGDQIGTYSIPVGNISGNSHIFGNVQFKADGTPTVIQVNFTDDPACIETKTGPTVQPCSTPAVCDILNINFSGNASACNDNGTPDDPTDDFFTHNIQASFINRPLTGSLQIVPGGDAIGTYSIPVSSISGNSHIFGNVQLKADGTPTVITLNFTDEPTCTETKTGITVQPCSVPAPCDITNLSLQNKSTCNDNGTNDPGDDFFMADIVVNFVHPPLTGDLRIPPGGDVLGTHLVPVADLVGLSHTFAGVQLKADGTTTIVTATFIGFAGSCALTEVNAAVQPCSSQPPVLTCPPAITVSCVGEMPVADATTVTETHTCFGNLQIIPISDVWQNAVCFNRLSVVRSYQAVDQCGQTATCSQTITINDQTPPTLTCPPSLTVACANQVPTVDPSSVSISDNCNGSTARSFVGDVISNQTCVNRFHIIRSYKGQDECGNSATCTQTITVDDQMPPSLTCPASQIVSCVGDVPAQNIALVTGLSDNCGGGAPTVGLVSEIISDQSCTNRFTLTRTYRAKDDCGNSATCSQVISVNDQTPPTFTFVPANTTVDCYLVPGLAIVTASDNCPGEVSVGFLGEVKTPGVCPVLYTLTRTWRAKDSCGNSATTSQVVTVTDTHAPQFLALPKNKVVECGPSNGAEFQAFIDNRGGAVAEDCSPFTFSYLDIPVQNNDYQCGNLFKKQIRFIATDACGNSSFREASFTVADLTAPVFSTPPQSVQLECADTDDNGENAFYTWLDSNAGLVAEDACGTVTIEKAIVGKKQGCGSTWQKTYEFRAKDECGNLTKTTATFAVVDHTPPTLECPPNDNLYLNCLDDVPAADPTALSTWDCSSVKLTLQDTWTKGTGCPNWPMTVAYRYAATDACGNVSVCERAFYVKETETPTLICPDTIKLICMDDIPGPVQLFSAIQNLLQGDCAGGFTSIQLLADSGQPQNGAKNRTYSFTAKNHCGLFTAPCSVTFSATGICNQLCTATEEGWGDPNGSIGGLSTQAVLAQLIQTYGPPTVGGGDHTVSAPTTACVQELLAGGGNCAFLPTGHYSCPLPDALANPDGSLNNHLAAHALAMQLNIWYNLQFNDRNLGVQDTKNLPDCLVEYPLLKDLGQNATVQDLLDMANRYLQGYSGHNAEEQAVLLNAALNNLNAFRVDCVTNAPCEQRPAQNRSGGTAIAGIQDIRLTPNPATDAVIISFESAVAGEIQIRISDSRGLRYLHKMQIDNGLNTTVVSLKNLPAGVYWVFLQGNATLETRRLVKIAE